MEKYIEILFTYVVPSVIFLYVLVEAYGKFIAPVTKTEKDDEFVAKFGNVAERVINELEKFQKEDLDGDGDVGVKNADPQQKG